MFLLAFRLVHFLLRERRLYVEQLLSWVFCRFILVLLLKSFLFDLLSLLLVDELLDGFAPLLFFFFGLHALLFLQEEHNTINGLGDLGEGFLPLLSLKA